VLSPTSSTMHGSVRQVSLPCTSMKCPMARIRSCSTPRTT
jgi:hypothetical protein